MIKFLLLFMLVSACSSSTALDAGDGEYDSFQNAGARADGLGVEEGSEEAIAILAVASNFQEQQLVVDVGVNTRTARNMIEERANFENGTFPSLEALDATPYFGPVSFAALRTYVREVDTRFIEISTDGADLDGTFEAQESRTIQLLASRGDVVRFSLRQRDGTSWNPKMQLFYESRLFSENPHGNADVFVPEEEGGFEFEDTGTHLLVISNTGREGGKFRLVVECIAGPCFEGGGEDPRPALRRQYQQTHRSFSYRAARAFMFETLDNVQGEVECVYTEERLATNSIPDHRVMNTEHSWPQSMGAVGAAKTDLHHLFPTMSNINSTRGNVPFCDVVDPQTDGISRLGFDRNGTQCFEPRDAHKGNVARAMFYFSTMYDLQIDPAQESTFRRWNVSDPVDPAERARADRIEGFQGSINPFVENPGLVDQVPNF